MTRVERLSKGVTLYLADCRDLLYQLGDATVLVTDPPYGINYHVNARSWQNIGLDAVKPFKMAARDPIAGDTEPFDPENLLGFKKIAIFGANHMAGLPPLGRWIVWDKRRDSTPDSHSDCELIWTNIPGADRIHRQKWRGIVREGEENTTNGPKLHSNQKPVALLSFVFAQIGVDPQDTVLDPYMGSGSTGVVAIRWKVPFLGVEIDPQHFEVALRRLEAELAKPPLELLDL